LYIHVLSKKQCLTLQMVTILVKIGTFRRRQLLEKILVVCSGLKLICKHNFNLPAYLALFHHRNPIQHLGMRLLWDNIFVIFSSCASTPLAFETYIMLRVSDKVFVYLGLWKLYIIIIYIIYGNWCNDFNRGTQTESLTNDSDIGHFLANQMWPFWFQNCTFMWPRLKSLHCNCFLFPYLCLIWNWLNFSDDKLQTFSAIFGYHISCRYVTSAK